MRENLENAVTLKTFADILYTDKSMNTFEIRKKTNHYLKKALRMLKNNRQRKAIQEKKFEHFSEVLGTTRLQLYLIFNYLLKGVTK